MCLSGTPTDNSAEIARQEEAARQARIDEGISNIDKSFSGFNDDFYNNYQNTYLDYYNPQLNDQYSEAVKRLTTQLAQMGQLTGSVGAKQLADLKSYYDTQKQSVVDQALGATNTLRGNVANQKSQLYSDNRDAADPGNASSAAAAAATALQPTAPSTPLAYVFSDFFSNLGNDLAISNAQKLASGSGVNYYSGGGRGSSGRVIG